MHDLNAVSEYAKFKASSAYVTALGTATDVHPDYRTEVAAEVGTDFSVTTNDLNWQRSRRRLFVANSDLLASDQGYVNVLSKFEEVSFSPDMSAFAVLDELRMPEEQIRRQIRKFWADSLLTYRERLSRRLEFLLDAMEEDGEVWSDDSPDSLRMLLRFLESVPDFRYPTVTITPSATFRAQWTAGSDRHFAIDFLPDGQVRLVVFCRDLRHSNRIKRYSGVTSWDSITRDVEPFDIRRWTTDAGR